MPLPHCIAGSPSSKVGAYGEVDIYKPRLHAMGPLLFPELRLRPASDPPQSHNDTNVCFLDRPVIHTPTQ